MTTITLKSNELIVERPFTSFTHIPKDLEILIYMAIQVCEVLETDIALLKGGNPIFVDEPDGRLHRFIIPRPEKLLSAHKNCVVGFFGQKREGVSPDYFTEYSNRLNEQIPSFLGVLSYSTMELPDGDFSNLVLLSDETIKSKWMDGETHQLAVEQSPGYYLSIRINNGFLPKGVINPDALQITNVKYCDYREKPPWRAERPL